MRIVQLLTRHQRRGAEVFAIQLSEHLKDKGHEVMVVTLLSGEGGLSFSGKMIHLSRPNRNFMDWEGFRMLKKILDDFQPDLVQANASDTLRYGVAAKFFSRTKFQLIYRNANMMSPFVKSRWTKSIYRFLLNQTTGIISVAEATKRDLLDFYLYSKKVEVIPIGIDGEEIIRLGSNESKLDLPQQFILFMGGWVPEKDPEWMLDWFIEYHRQYPDLHLIFLGKGLLESKLLLKTKEAELQERVWLIPNQRNPFPILNKARALVLPSKIEGLPGVILEAMVCRVPVIAYGVGGISEVLKNGETGWCIPPKDQNGFIQAIEAVLAMDTDSKDVILSNAFQLVSSNYSLQKVALRFEGFYKSLLDSHGK